MKRLIYFLAFSVVLIFASCSQKVVPNRPTLQLTLAFHGNDTLRVCLKNVGENSIKLRVNKNEFEGFFEIYAGDAIISRAYPEKFWNLMLTGVWENPMVIMQREETICWQVSTAALIHKDVENRDQVDVLGDRIVAVCERIYAQGVDEMEKVELQSNSIEIKKAK